MIVLEMKAVVKPSQCSAIDEAILTVQFIRNKALRLWMDAKREDKIDKYSLNKYCAVLAKQFKFVDTLNSTARQASAERAWSAIARFYDNCKKGIKGKKGYPKFRKIIVLWNIKPLAGNYQRIERKLLLQTKKTSARLN
jgi:transposase